MILITLLLALSVEYLIVEAECVRIGNWTYHAHGCKGGKVTILDKRRIQIENFNYDGKGPEAWFQIGLAKKVNKPLPCANHRRHPIIPDDKGQCSKKPKSYSNAKLILTIPNEYDWEKIDYVGLYCYKFQHLFGYVKIPKFNTSKLGTATPKIDSCLVQEKRILKDSTSPVTCGLKEPWKTSGGSFP